MTIIVYTSVTDVHSEPIAWLTLYRVKAKAPATRPARIGLATTEAPAPVEAVGAADEEAFLAEPEAREPDAVALEASVVVMKVPVVSVDVPVEVEVEAEVEVLLE